MLTQECPPTTTRRIRKGDATAAHGLCSSCIHAQDCVLIRARDSPILFCEEFEVRGAPLQGGIGGEKIEGPRGNKQKSKGLCLNCANTFTCTHPEPELGVWFCEEYR